MTHAAISGRGGMNLDCQLCPAKPRHHVGQKRRRRQPGHDHRGSWTVAWLEIGMRPGPDTPGLLALRGWSA